VVRYWYFELEEFEIYLQAKSRVMVAALLVVIVIAPIVSSRLFNANPSTATRSSPFHPHIQIPPMFYFSLTLYLQLQLRNLCLLP